MSRPQERHYPLAIQCDYPNPECGCRGCAGEIEPDDAVAPDSPAPADHRTEEMREFLGQQVRLIWIAWAEEQPNPKLSWLRPWHEMSEPDREVDRRIGERLYAQGRSAQWEVLAADLSKVMADRDRWLATAREYEAAIGVLAPENDRVGTENERLRAQAQRVKAMVAKTTCLTPHLGNACPCIFHELYRELNGTVEADQ